MNANDIKLGNALNDEELIRRIQNHDKDAFRVLMKKHMNSVFNICYRITGDYDDANDCAQDTFVKVYRNLGGFRFQSGLSTWMHRIAVNTCKNHLASLGYRIRKKSLRLDSPYPTEDGSVTLELRDSGSDPETLFSRKSDQETIRKAIQSLPGDERILIVLRDIEGRSYEEVAMIAGIKLGTVKSRLARARHTLRDMLKGVFL